MIENAIFAALSVYLAVVALPRLYSAVRWQAIPVGNVTYRRAEQPIKFWVNAVVLVIVAVVSVFGAVALGHAVLVEVLA